MSDNSYSLSAEYFFRPHKNCYLLERREKTQEKKRKITSYILIDTDVLRSR